MKILLTALMIAFSMNSLSQEERSPKFTCVENESGAEYFVLIGNKFPQIPDRDYSSQLQMVEKDNYYEGTAYLQDIFTIKNITENSFETEVLQMENQGINQGSISLKLNNDGKLIQTFIMPDEHAEFLGIEDTTMILEFSCSAFK
jgi:hypothetical protein